MNDKRPFIKKLLRSLEIDFNYLSLPINQSNKFMDVAKTNLYLAINLMSKKILMSNIKIGKIQLSYDSVYATKIFLDTCYDFYIETHRLSILPKNPVIIDVGANIGQFMFAVKSFFPNSYVYSFEPDPDIYLHLEKNASQFSNTKTFCTALSDKKGEEEFYRDKDFSVWSSLVKPGSGRKFSKIKVAMSTGDNMLSKIKKIDLIKIDVEGAELEVLLGMKNTVKKSKYLLIESSLARESGDEGSGKLISHIINNNFILHSVGRIYQDGKGGTQGAVDLLFKNKKYNE